MIIFELSFPSAGSWNGKFSGEDRLHAITKDIRDKDKIKQLIGNSPYWYNWGDGWSASIKVFELKGNELQKYKRKIKGFMGYDWMVDSILSHGKILTERERTLEN